MKFNPITNKLYTNDNRFIKKIYCPHSALKWDALSTMEESMDRFCAICESSVVETKELSDDTLLQLLKDKPDTCLKIDFNQENIRIVHNV